MMMIGHVVSLPFSFSGLLTSAIAARGLLVALNKEQEVDNDMELKNSIMAGKVD